MFGKFQTLSFMAGDNLKAMKVLAKEYPHSWFKTYFEYLRLNHTVKLSVEEYVNYSFATRGDDFKNSFLPKKKVRDYWGVLNPRKNASIARDKFIAHCLFDELGIRSSRLLFLYDKASGDHAGSKMCHSAEEVAARLRELGVTTFIAKQSVDGAHGQGVGLYNVSDFVEFGGSKPIESILKCDCVVFEDVVKQTRQMASFNESSVNTVRIMTALYPDHEVKIIASFLKIGRKGSFIDNAGAGGNIDCGVDAETGELFNALEFDSWKSVKPVERHPDSNVQLNGTVIENWPAIIEEVKSWQARIPWLKTIGWDVAITDEGPVIIEINNWWDATGQLFIGKGWHKEVRSCYDAWVGHHA